MFFKPKLSVAILGGGISGLVAAWRLTGMGHRVRLFEQTGRLGGTVRTEMVDGWLIEAGPQSFRETSHRLRTLLSDLKIDQDRIYADEKVDKRYLVHKGRLVTVPRSPAAFLASPLLSPPAKVRAMADLIWIKRPRPDDRSFANFMGRHFGRQFVERVVQPMVSGTCAGDAKRLSSRYAFPKLWEWEWLHGSLIRGLRFANRPVLVHRDEIKYPRIASFERGLQTFYHALVLGLPSDVISLNARVKAVEQGRFNWSVVWNKLDNPLGSSSSDGAEGEEVTSEAFDLVLSTLPPAALAKLAVGTARTRPMASLADVENASLSSLFLGFRREQVAHPLDGFGVLAAPHEKRKMLGAVFCSTLFPRRAPEGHVALNIMAGGVFQPELALLPTDELIAAVRPDLEDLLGIRGEPVFVRHNPWPQAIPQYNLGYEKHVATMVACERANPGLLIGGQARDGVSLTSAVAGADALVSRVLAAERKMHAML